MIFIFGFETLMNLGIHILVLEIQGTLYPSFQLPHRAWGALQAPNGGHQPPLGAWTTPPRPCQNAIRPGQTIHDREKEEQYKMLLEVLMCTHSNGCSVHMHITWILLSLFYEI